MTCNFGGTCEDKVDGECASDGPGSAKGEGMAHTLPNEKCPTCGELAQQVPGDVRLVCDVWVCEKCKGAWPSEGAGNNLTKQLAALKDELARAREALDDARRLAIRLNAFLGHEPRDCAMVDSLAGELLAALAGAGGAAMSCENCERLKDENERAREALADRMERIPKGYHLIVAYANDAGRVVILGEPEPEELSTEETGHNCDAMGCGSFDHVIARLNLPPGTKPDVLPPGTKPDVLQAALHAEVERLREKLADEENLIVIHDNYHREWLALFPEKYHKVNLSARIEWALRDLSEAEAELARVREVLPAITVAEAYLFTDDCGCGPDGHVCGKPRVLAALASIRSAISPAPEPEKEVKP